MKKILTVIVAVIAVSCIMLSSFSAESTQLKFLATPTADYADGGIWASNLTVTADGNDIVFSVTDSRCIWAFANSVIDGMPYLSFEIPDSYAGNMRLTLSNNWDAIPEVEITFQKGLNVVNLPDKFSEAGNGYYYVCFYCNATETEGRVSNMMLSSDDPSAQNGPAAETADFVSVAVMVSAAVAAAVTLLKRR
ncbi:MAG: hypothetical protein IKS28_07750 [Clostridia bacterium]|nr:hypothetical protein [Clostridia bacterium]